jgi:hypothetical protein
MGILDTVAEPSLLLACHTLKVGEETVLLGGNPKPFEVVAFPLLFEPPLD